MDLKERKKIRVTETLPISRPTVTGLLDAFRDAFKGKDKPVRVLYNKGEDLIIERSILTDSERLEDGLLTPYQMIRQHSELEIQEVIPDPLLACCSAVQELRRKSFPLTFVVVYSIKALNEWLPTADLADLFGVDVFEDPDAPDECLFFCGSALSPMIRDIEQTICCRMV